MLTPKDKQFDMLKNDCEKANINFESMRLLLESVRVKKLIKRNNYHQQKINEEIEKAVK